MGAFSRLFSIVSFLVCAYIAYQVIVRYLKIKDLDKTVIREREKSDYLEILRKYIKIVGGVGIIDLAFFILPWLEARMIIAVGAIIIASYVYQDLLDEIADFDVSKKDADILKDFLKEVSEDGKKKAKNNKVKKVDSENIGANGQFDDGILENLNESNEEISETKEE